jgi:tetratricopeptide (TPR) repeat protein
MFIKIGYLYKFFLLHLCVFLLSIGSLLAVSPVEKYITELVNKRGDQRIIYLHYVLGNEDLLVEDKDSLKHFIALLQSRKWNEPKFQEHVNYFIHTYDCIIEKDLTKRIQLYNTHLRAYKDDIYFSSAIQHHIGTSYYVQQQYAKALEHYMQAENGFEQIGYNNIPEAGMYLHDWALAYHSFKEYDRVIALMKISIEHVPFSDNLNIQRYYTLANSYIKIKKYDKALPILYKAKEQAQILNDTFWIVQSITGQIVLNTILQHWDVAEQEIQEGRTLLHEFMQKKYNTFSEEVFLFEKFKLATLRYYIESNQPYWAQQIFASIHRPYLAPALNKFRWNERNNNFLLNYYKGLNRYYAFSKEWKLSKVYVDSLYQLETQLNHLYNTSIIDLSKDRLALKERELLVRKLKQDKIINITIILFLIVVIVCIYLFFRYYKVKREKENAELKLQKERMEYELSITRMEESLLQVQLNDYVKNFNNKASFIDELSHDLNLLQDHASSEWESDEIVKVITQLHAHGILTEEDWLAFQQLFQQSKNQELELLLNLSPTLTSQELRHLMLLLLNVESKVIANVLGLSTEEVHALWNNMTAKYDIDQHASLEDFMALVSQFNEV